MTNQVYSLTPPPAAATGVVLVDPATGISYAASGGGGGGGAVTVADGADVTQGSQTDTAYTTGSGSVVSILKAIFAKVTAFLNAQGSTTSGQSGPLAMGAVTTANPTYSTTQTSPLSLAPAGNLRVQLQNGSSANVWQNFNSAAGAFAAGFGSCGLFLSAVPLLTNSQSVGLLQTQQGSLKVSSGGQSSALNITTPTTVKGTPGRIGRIVLSALGSSDTTIIDSTGTSVTAANTVAVISHTGNQQGVPISMDWPCLAGIGVVPGTGATVSISYD